MVDVSGIPNMGFGGGGYFGGSAALGYPAMSAAQINASMGWNPNAAQFDPFANSPGGFGAQTAYYQQAAANNYGNINAAASGGGYNPAAWATPSGSVEYGGGLPGIPYQDPFSGGGTPQFDPWTGAYTGNGGGITYLPDGTPMGEGGGFGGYQGGGIGSDLRHGGQNGPANPYEQMYRMPQANPSYFNPATYAGDLGNYGIPYNGRAQVGDIGFSRQSQMPNLGYNPGMSNWFANPALGGGAFQGRFGMGFPNAGTPSQYAPGAQMPPGFAGPYSVDNPGGALPLDNYSPFFSPYSVGNSQEGG
jgi:hypothetical protein